MAGEAHGQVAGILRCGFLSRLHQEAEAGQVLGSGKGLLGER